MYPINLNTQILGWLRVFVVSARTLSFTRAGEELHVTTGAVSQQIKLLEERLGCRLFYRRAHGLSLTDEGRRLALVVDDAYQTLASVIAGFDSRSLRGIVHLRSRPSFLAKWLVPRLPEFTARFPEIQLQLQAEDSNQPLRIGEFDLAIDLLEAGPAGLLSTPLMEEEIFPVCAPSLLEGGAPLRSVGDLAGYPLLHDITAWRGSNKYAEWEFYVGATGGAHVDVRRGHTFNRNHIAVEAAIAGMGVAIARHHLMADALDSGRLVAPLRERVVTGRRYLLVHAPGALDDLRIRALHDWLVEISRRESCSPGE